MKQFAKVSALFISFCVIFVVATAIVVPIIPPQYSETYQASLLDKVDRLDNTTAPKIVLVGTSQLVFGISSDILEQEFDMPVVNMGLHGGLSDKFMWDMSLSGIYEGDIVIVSTVDFVSWGNDIELSLITLENHKHLWERLDSETIKKLLPYYYTVYPSKAVPRLVFDTFIKQPLGALSADLLVPSDPAYKRNAFNDYGDNIYPRTTLDYMYTKEFLSHGGFSLDDEYISQLDEFRKAVEDRGAELFVITSPIFEPGLVYDIDTEQKKLEQNVPGFISDLSSYVYPTEYFFDTAYHLTNEGADVWTAAIANDLKRALSE